MAFMAAPTKLARAGLQIVLLQGRMIVVKAEVERKP
jgi:hypothetical protein